jgi:hypothetical protein
MPGRVGAWLLDGILVGLLSLIPVIFAFLSGAVTLNGQALDQLSQIEPGTYQPFALVTVAIVHVNIGVLVVAVGVYVVLHLVYFAGSWVRMGGTPAQRALKIRVADDASGANLSVDQALLRWLLLEGISTIAGGVVLILFLNIAATTPMNQLFGDRGGFGAFGYGSAGVTIVSDVVSWGSTLWLIVLVVSAGASSLHRGLHDRISGSVVLKPAPAYPSWSGYGATPPGAGYWPTQGGPGFYGSPQPWPGYPPQSSYPPGPSQAPSPYPGYGAGAPPAVAPPAPPAVAPPGGDDTSTRIP